MSLPTRPPPSVDFSGLAGPGPSPAAPYLDDAPPSPVEVIDVELNLPFGWRGEGGLGEGYACRGCGCTDGDACPEGCAWVDRDLCSSCDGRVEVLERPDPLGRHGLTIRLALVGLVAYVAGLWSAVGVYTLIAWRVAHG